MDIVPPFNYTPLDDIPTIAGQIRKTFLSHKTRPIEYRLAQLRKLYWGYVFSQLRTRKLYKLKIIVASKTMARLLSRPVSGIWGSPHLKLTLQSLIG